MRKRVGVDCVVDDRLRMRADFALDDDRVIEERRCSCGLSELRGELTEGEMLASSIDQAEGGDIPEHGGATVAEHDFVTMREARDKTLGVPRLILPSIQVNIRAGELPAAEGNGVRYLKLPIDAL